jgi:hypothetical protein
VASRAFTARFITTRSICGIDQLPRLGRGLVKTGCLADQAAQEALTADQLAEVERARLDDVCG